MLIYIGTNILINGVQNKLEKQINDSNDSNHNNINELVKLFELELITQKIDLLIIYSKNT